MNITPETIEDLSSAIEAAANAYEKIPDSNLRSAAKGLAHASVMKLHELINLIELPRGGRAK